MINPKALNNRWFFTRGWNDLRAVYELGNSIATFESEEAERSAVAWIRDHPRRPLGEWSDLADPFEPAAWTDWSPVRSAKLATPARTRPPCSDRGKPRPLNASGIPATLSDLHARMDAC